MQGLNSSQDLIDLFGDITLSGYINPTFLNDTKVGFSIQRKYPTNIRYKPAKNTAGHEDNIAVIWVVYDTNRQNNNLTLVPLRLRIAMMSEYRAKHWDYDFSDDTCPTEESIRESLSSPQPFDLDLYDYYFHSINDNKFVDANSTDVTGIEILNKLFNAHCDSVHPLKGFPLRSKRATQRIFRFMLDQLINGQKWILEKVFSRTLDERLNRSTYIDGYLKDDMKILAVGNMEIAGYRTSKNIVLLFAIVVVTTALFVLPVTENTYAGNVLRSETLMIAHSLIVLYFLDTAIPNLLFRSMNLTICFRKRFLNWLLKR